ncbi:MAG: hypothetical protein ACYC99_08710 [Candidatus Geothermincolia bacterium]
MATSLDSDKQDNERLCNVMIAAFEKAYPDVSHSRIEHMARNFVQVVGGVIDIGSRVPTNADGTLTHMDVANSMVFWCIANTRLEEFCENGVKRGEEGRRPVIPAEDADLLRREFAARIADWLAGMEALKADPETYASFIRGTLAIGTRDWETNRGELGF